MTTTYPIMCRIRGCDDGSPTRVDVYDDIGPGGWFSDGLTAKDFTATMAGVTGAVEVHINSAGGDVFDGIAITNALRAHQGEVTTVVDGLAASIASVIAQAGSQRIMQANSMMMIHDASGFCYGNAEEAAAFATTLGKVSDNIADIYASRSGRGSAATWRAEMKAETWYTADEAVAAGLADRTGDGQAQLPAGMDLAAFSTVPGRIAARLRAMPQASAPRAAAAPHGPMTGTHTHPHPAYGSQGADSTHEHEHSHDGDAGHGHDHGDGTDDRHGGRPRGGAEPGECCAQCGPDCACSTAAASARAPGRILGIESMPLTAKALPVHHTATIDEPWDGPAAVTAMPADAKVLRYCHAWQDSSSDDGTGDDPDGDADDKKSSYKFPHHKTDGAPANLAACRNGLSRLPGADIPESDRAGVKAHLQAHLDDGTEDGADDHARTGTSAADAAEQLKQYRAALKGARA